MCSAPTAASTMFPGVSKSGSPISRWTMFLPWRSKARARTRTSKAVSVPRRDILLARCSLVGAEVASALIVFFLELRAMGCRHQSHLTFCCPVELAAVTRSPYHCEEEHEDSG